MSYVINPTGRSRLSRISGRANSSGCSGCAGNNLPGNCGYGCYHHHCGYTRAAERTTGVPVVYTTADCACPDGCPAPYVRNVIYTGPCPPSPDCPCQPPLPPPPPDPPCYRPIPAVTSYAYFAQTGAVAVSAQNGVIALDSVSDASDSFELDGGIVTVNKAGTFLATFTMSLPANSTVNTQLTNILDGVALPGSIVSINKRPGSPGSVVSQAVFTSTGAGNEFAVISSQPFAITGDTSADTLAALTITQLDGGLYAKVV
ncbi:MAG: hypothetical protein Q4D04_06145 [Clostridia bacterium]|nr:hypothetical protein [Clostridia bacterium]